MRHTQPAVKEHGMQHGREFEDRPPLPGAGRMENYTGPFLVVAGVLCFVMLFALWAAWGLPAVLALAALVNWALPKG
jgi:hypothetical protein